MTAGTWYQPLLQGLESLARLYPEDVDPGEDLRLALDFLDWPITAADVVRAGYVLGAIVGMLCVAPAVLVPSKFRVVVFLAAVSLGLLTTHTVHTGPKLWATARRTRALGATPDLVARTVLSMRLSPTPERAAVFTARTGEGRLANSLEKHVRQTRHTARSGLAAFGDAWADLFPALRRSVALVTAAGNAAEHDRGRLLDQALTVVMDGTRDQMQSFGAQVRTPATALYAFGVLLPTALVALLPAAGAAGVGVTPLSVVVLYNVVLPGILVGAGIWLLARRPVAFPPPDVTTEQTGVTDWRRLALAVGAFGTVAGWLIGTSILPSWGPPILAVGLGAGLWLWLRYRPIVSVYGRIRDVEESLPDALSLVGRRVANGRAVETAIDQAADELDGEAGEMLADGATRQRQLQIGVHEAFLGRHGALEQLPSPRVRGSIALLALAAREGRPAGSALLSLAEHVEDLQTIEQEARHSLAHVCRTLQSTGMVFAPMVAGSTVALAEGIGGQTLLGGSGQSLVWLGGPVGVYVLFLAAFLTALATGLTRGLDQSLVGYRAGRALVCAGITYTVSYLLVGILI
ncbi:type II secretion system F family protein [Halobacteriaceae bacterium SHR40]|uniref:type II secretion system F family protein n=1 Tax=Halovenus amylolytica TaxID=2500550 RepID=UPI000FE3F28E